GAPGGSSAEGAVDVLVVGLGLERVVGEDAHHFEPAVGKEVVGGRHDDALVEGGRGDGPVHVVEAHVVHLDGDGEVEGEAGAERDRDGLPRKAVHVVDVVAVGGPVRGHEVAAARAAVVAAEPVGRAEVGGVGGEGLGRLDGRGGGALVEGARADELQHGHEGAGGGHLDLVADHV